MKTEDYRLYIADICRKEFAETVDVELMRPDEQFGDYSTNVAMRLSAKLGKNPREIAELIAKNMLENNDFADVSVAGPGFINITLKDVVLLDGLRKAVDFKQAYKDKVVVTEYSDPNPFKVLHAGHLYTTLVGDAISNILEAAGARVWRTNFGGDVGLHVAKAMWGILQKLGGEKPEGLNEVDEDKRPEWISECYVAGNKAYEDKKSEIDALNKKIYQVQADQDKTSPFAQIYWTCRQWSYDGFEKLYSDLNVKPFDKYYPESLTAPEGVRLAEKAREDGVLEDSGGAVVYRGEKDGLHTRVFLTGEKLPTYEAKDLGLIEHKWHDYKFDQSVIITGNDIIEYMKVVLKVASHFHANIEKQTTHLTHGMVKLPGGKKMSSRAGSVILAGEILEAAKKASKNRDQQVVLGAVRYSFLKNSIGGEVIYNPEESVSLEGNSGPYLQYALVRAKSILNKVDKRAVEIPKDATLDSAERSLARALSSYPEAFEASLNEYSPHHLCNYLYGLAVTFNRFYEKSRVIGDPRSEVRIPLVKTYKAVLSSGLDLLGMPKPEKM